MFDALPALALLAFCALMVARHLQTRQCQGVLRSAFFARAAVGRQDAGGTRDAFALRVSFFARAAVGRRDGGATHAALSIRMSISAGAAVGRQDAGGTEEPPSLPQAGKMPAVQERRFFQARADFIWVGI
ncbi:MAG TPA: hypothetical protein VF099_13015 [Ktedonobacterales bacterium]